MIEKEIYCYTMASRRGILVNCIVPSAAACIYRTPKIPKFSPNVSFPNLRPIALSIGT